MVRGIYRVYFHPLSRFPGPKFSAFTRLPYLTAIAKGKLPRHVAQLHKQYGEIVRISPDELSFTNPKAWRDIYGYGSKEGPGSAPPKNWNRQGSSPNGANSLVAERDNVEHARIRRIFSPAFSDRALVQQSPLFIKYADQLIRNLRESVQANAVDLVRMVTKRLEKGRVSEGVDLWDLVLQQEDKGKAGLTRPVMDMNGELFMIAGTETTATLISGLTYLLLTHPEAMAKLVDEIRTAFSSSDDVNMEITAGLPYLNACIKEAFRHYPPVPIGLPHLTPAEGSTVCGIFVPPNTNVAASHLAMYNSPDNFILPERFIPERWLGDPRFASDDRSALQPFHVGPRDCLGKK
ncbi:hypothetical protein J4E93_001991 [Alternaria ventricosa]|uniref:uncharacterized protein n=1 Tax=Alternaria ventricosa TaxID=1187951 RepID=UPI0020C31DE5|nr:uncharacterized protein J4E93_001991 [Alternaria ventricosa]KAI4651795.1 hypothetical protein J4E93_001991 [Alternaria ventricosa]